MPKKNRYVLQQPSRVARFHLTNQNYTFWDSETEMNMGSSYAYKQLLGRVWKTISGKTIPGKLYLENYIWKNYIWKTITNQLLVTSFVFIHFHFFKKNGIIVQGVVSLDILHIFPLTPHILPRVSTGYIRAFTIQWVRLLFS